MADRLTKIVTRGGDKGETSLADGTRLTKDELRIALIGDVDELNSWIGVVIAHGAEGALRGTLSRCQHDLFDMGGGLSFPGTALLSEEHVKRLDDAAENLNADLPPLKEFILPGGSKEVSFCHVARTVCRRSERLMATFLRSAPEAAHGLQYLNRLSDILFIAARVEARRVGVAEVYWSKSR